MVRERRDRCGRAAAQLTRPTHPETPMVRRAYQQRSLIEVLLPDADELWEPALRSADPISSSIIRIMAASTPRSITGSGVSRSVSGRRWGPSATRTTMRCARASSRPCSASCSNRERFRTPVGARRAVFDYIEGWDNPQWRHSALDYESPRAR